MDRIKHRKRKPKKPQKTLLSLVDPWDVKVASIAPESLASRRGASLSALSYIPDGDISPSHTRTPSPWYKPSYNNNSTSPRSPAASDNDNGLLSSPEWPLPWYKPLRSPTSELISESTLSVPSHKSSRITVRFDEKTSTPTENIDEATARNIAKFSESNGKNLESINGPVIQVHVEHESGRASNENIYEPNGAHHELEVPNIVVNDETPSEIRELTVGSEENVRNPSTNGPSMRNELPESESDRIFGVENGEHQGVAFIINDLVTSRYSPTTARERRLNRPSSRSPPTYEDVVTVDIGTGEPSTSVLNSQHLAIVNSTSSSETSEKGTEPPNETNGLVPDRLDKMDGLGQAMYQQATNSRFRRQDSDSSATFSNSGSTPRGSPLDSDTDDDVDDEELSKVPLQGTPRRKVTTVVPMPTGQKLNKDQLEVSGGQSANSTITSVNSISSLLKEKLQLSIPQTLRSNKKQQNVDYRLKGFVGTLFLSIVFLVGFAHIYYTQNVLQRAYFDRFRFNKNDRVMHIYSESDAEIVAARLGEGISPETKVFPCLAKDLRPNSVCLEWLQQARLYLSHTQERNMFCYQVTWQSLSPSYDPMDCYDWSPERGHWYGAGQIQNTTYTLDGGRATLELSPFITGDLRKKNSFGNVLRRYFLNSEGVTITVDPDTPLHVSINVNRTKNFCLQAKHDAFAYINHLTPLPQLNYTICAFENMKTLHSRMTDKWLWDGLKMADSQIVTALLTEPVWQIAPADETAITNYVDGITDLGFLKRGHIILDNDWQLNAGDLDIDLSRFPDMKEAINNMHLQGFKVVLSIQPFVSTESKNFKETVTNRLLVSERGSDPGIPALTKYKKSNSVAVLDITNNKTTSWLQNKIQYLADEYKVDAFYLDMGNAHDMPHYYKCQQPLTNPDYYKTLFTQTVLTNVPVIGVSGAIARPPAPVFVSLPQLSSSWKAIKTVIPTLLNYGIIGYPFIMPGAVGGDIALPMSDNNPHNDFDDNLPDKELYIRWFQLSTFLPVIRFTHLPSKYEDETIIKIANSLTELRQNTVTPLVKKYAFEALDSGLPIIRPLWMLDPMDPACHVVLDEFAVGDDLIVAPILHSGSRQRAIYLPKGVWKDGVDGSLRKGSRWIHNYRVALDKVAYFVKQPDETRF